MNKVNFCLCRVHVDVCGDVQCLVVQDHTLFSYLFLFTYFLAMTLAAPPAEKCQATSACVSGCGNLSTLVFQDDFVRNKQSYGGGGAVFSF